MQREVHPGETRHAKRRELVFLALCLLAGLLLSVLPLLGWSSYNALHLLSHTQIFSNYSILYLMCSFVVLSITTFLAIRAMKLRRLYPAEIFWERHKYELRINDPEMTTRASVTSSNQSRATVRSNRSFWSRRSSGRSGILSFVSTPMASRKTSQQSRAQDNVLLEVVFRQAQLNAIKRFSFSANGTNEDTGKETSEMRLSVPSPDTEWKTRSVSNPRDPSVISSRIPHNFPIFRVGKKVFQSPRLLPQFKALQQQRSLSRLLLMKSCVTALCWLPLISINALQLSSVHYPQELHVFIQWLIFIPSSISPLFALCDARYRQVLRRAACAVVKTCACGTKTQTAKTRDVEFKIEGTQQVRLTNVKI
ncbi:hypothetical protein OS493_023805 [Desmophyllum pertusum]|uniref:Uncharacterized protein n=1 Tax=Desmophyllum pertusum TaxID=174260 RepID=A0A9W9YLX7_9CNID|nr:hypothetical protein OS493_023805 [Desmophyllum pertusum]